jgi:DNA-directed RNA polymerase subunit beta'
MFNDILPKKMSYYNQTLGSKDLARVISDCYLELGRRETIELLDRMKSAVSEHQRRAVCRSA